MIGRLRLLARGGSGVIPLRAIRHRSQKNDLARSASEVLELRQRGSIVRSISSGRSLWKEPEKASPEEGSPRPNSAEAMPDHMESPIIKATAAAAAEAASKYSQQYTSAYVELEKNLMARIHESSSRRFRLALISTIVFIVWVVAVFGKMIRKALSDQTAGLAKETLENADLKVQTEELAMAVVRTVLNDTQVTANAAAFLREAAMMPETQQALLKLTIHVLQHKESLQEASGLVKRLLAQLSKDKEAMESLGTLFAASLQEPAVKAAAVALITDLCKDPEIMAAVTELTLAVINKEEVGQVRFFFLPHLFLSRYDYAQFNAPKSHLLPPIPFHPTLRSNDSQRARFCRVSPPPSWATARWWRRAETLSSRSWAMNSSSERAATPFGTASSTRSSQASSASQASPSCASPWALSGLCSARFKSLFVHWFVPSCICPSCTFNQWSL